MKRLLATAALVLAAGAPVPAHGHVRPASPTAESRSMTMRFRNVRLGDVLRFLARHEGIDILFPSAIDDTRIESATLDRLPVQDALRTILTPFAHTFVVVNDTTIHVVEQPAGS